MTAPLPTPSTTSWFASTSSHSSAPRGRIRPRALTAMHESKALRTTRRASISSRQPSNALSIQLPRFLMAYRVCHPVALDAFRTAPHDDSTRLC